jgi:hypothetical protein
MNRVAEEELGRGVHRVAEEELLQVDRGAITRNAEKHALDVPIQGIEIRDAVFDEGRAEEGAGVCSSFAICREDAVAEYRHHGVYADGGEVEIFEFCRQNGLDVLRVYGEHGGVVQRREVNVLPSFS